MPTVWFIRHAESEANAGLPTAHPATIKLTPRGIEQANRVAQFIKHRPGLIVSSPYERAWQTARPTFEQFAPVPYETWPVHEFTYLASPDTLTTASDRRPMVEAFWKRYDPLYVDGQDAESFVDFISRVRYVVKKLRQSKEDFIVVFSHEQFICSIVWLLLNGKIDAETEVCADSMKRFRYFLKSFTMPNGSILPMQLQDDSETWFSSIITSHLSEPYSST
ncbi:MAG TPA: histidine phosphatase family protein [Ktedonobacteraceae bacterium]|nr:histidine phosphatase family protein [Ktedonobacteraceae bacterium]